MFFKFLKYFKYLMIKMGVIQLCRKIINYLNNTIHWSVSTGDGLYHKNKKI